jgi:hypothetical protein
MLCGMPEDSAWGLRWLGPTWVLLVGGFWVAPLCEQGREVIRFNP